MTNFIHIIRNLLHKITKSMKPLCLLQSVFAESKNDLEIIYKFNLTDCPGIVCRKNLTRIKKTSMINSLNKMGCWVVPAERKQLDAFNPFT